MYTLLYYTILYYTIHAMAGTSANILGTGTVTIVQWVHFRTYVLLLSKTNTGNSMALRNCYCRHLTGITNDE
jgi:hypothetical protein